MIAAQNGRSLFALGWRLSPQTWLCVVSLLLGGVVPSWAIGQDRSSPQILPVAPYVPNESPVARTSFAQSPSQPAPVQEVPLQDEPPAEFRRRVEDSLGPDTAPARSSATRYDPIPLSRPSESRESTQGATFKTPAGVFRNTALSLGLVLALFLGVAWFLKKSQPRSHAALPREAVEVLGRVAISQKQQLQLIRMGPKLLLVASTGGQLQTLGEISDPHQVNQMMSICQSGQPGAISQSFRQVMGQYEREPVNGFLGDVPENPAAEATPAPRTRRRRAWS